MSKYLIGDNLLSAIANEIRSKDGTTDNILVSNLASRISSLEVSGLKTLQDVNYGTKNYNYSIDDTTLSAIGNAIKSKAGISTPITVGDFPKYIKALQPFEAEPIISYTTRGTQEGTSTAQKLQVYIPAGKCEAINNVVIFANEYSVKQSVTTNADSVLRCKNLGTYYPSYTTSGDECYTEVYVGTLPKGFSGIVDCHNFKVNKTDYNTSRSWVLMVIGNAVYDSYTYKTFSDKLTTYSFSTGIYTRTDKKLSIPIIFSSYHDSLYLKTADNTRIPAINNQSRCCIRTFKNYGYDTSKIITCENVTASQKPYVVDIVLSIE